jgi:hypothetical protein
MGEEYIYGWGRFPEAKRDKTAVSLHEVYFGMPLKVPDNGFTMDAVQVKPVDYNLDYNEDVDNFLQEIKQNPETKELYRESMEKIRRQAEAGDIDAINYYEAVRDAMGKTDPMGLRSGGRAATNRDTANKSSVVPDFDWRAMQGKDDVDKKYNYEGILRKNIWLYPDSLH